MEVIQQHLATMQGGRNQASADTPSQWMNWKPTDEHAQSQVDDSKRKRLRDDEAPEPDLVLGVDPPEDGPPPATKRRRHGSSGGEADIATTAASASKKSRDT